VERICLVRDGRLVRTARRIPFTRSAAQQLADLLAGPTAAESADGLISALATAEGITLGLQEGRAVVEVGDLVAQGGRSDQILAFGQIVCTLGSRLDVGTVTFTSNGQPLDVPRADGSLATGPVTIADYATLIEP
jgi:spore germination protein GerM